MDVMNPEQAKIAERAGACAVMALEKIPADIRAEAGVARMSDPKMIKEIQQAVSIPVMAKVTPQRPSWKCWLVVQSRRSRFSTMFLTLQLYKFEILVMQLLNFLNFAIKFQIES